MMRFKQIQASSSNGNILIKGLSFQAIDLDNYFENDNTLIYQIGIECPNVQYKNDIAQDTLIAISADGLGTIDGNGSRSPAFFYISKRNILEFEYLRLKVSDIEYIAIEPNNPYIILNIGYEG